MVQGIPNHASRKLGWLQPSNQEIAEGEREGKRGNEMGGGREGVANGLQRGTEEQSSSSLVSFETKVLKKGPFYILKNLSEVGNPITGFTYFFQNK